jgi:hypothetical protein
MPYPNYDDFEARGIVENEGLEYAVRHYTNAESFKNPETAKLWGAAAKALDALVAHLHLEDG